MAAVRELLEACGFEPLKAGLVKKRRKRALAVEGHLHERVVAGPIWLALAVLEEALVVHEVGAREWLAAIDE